jgi:hypothetical protein
VPDQAAPFARDGTANWSLAGVSAVRVALMELNVLAKLPRWAYALAFQVKAAVTAPLRPTAAK